MEGTHYIAASNKEITENGPFHIYFHYVGFDERRWHSEADFILVSKNNPEGKHPIDTSLRGVSSVLANSLDDVESMITTICGAGEQGFWAGGGQDSLTDPSRGMS